MNNCTVQTVLDVADNKPSLGWGRIERNNFPENRLRKDRVRVCHCADFNCIGQGIGCNALRLRDMIGSQRCIR